MRRAVRLIPLIVLSAFGILKAQVDTAWVRRYDGPAHSTDYATCIAADSAGSVIVAGTSMGADSTYDFVTIKYYPDGDTAWVRRLNLGGNNIPRGMAVDRQSNVYLTGQGSGKIVTVKYSPTGQLLWSLRRGADGDPGGICLDQQNSVFVGGAELRATRDAVVTKYHANGDTAWTRFIDWAGYGDAADVLTVGQGGDVSAAGFCADSVPGGDLLAFAYSSSGVGLWTARYDGPQHGSDWASAVAADGAGNTLVAGVSDNGYGTPLDYVTLKYNSQGETLWVRRYNGTANGRDEAHGLVCDGTGGVIVTGSARFSDTDFDFTTIKYGPDGSVVWLARYDGPAHSGDGAYAIAVDADDRVYVTGSSYDPRSLADAVTICCTPAGETAWVRRYNSPQNWAEYTTAMCLGPDGSVCVAGIAYDASGLNSDILTIKYTQPGSVQSPQVPPVGKPGPNLEALPVVFRDRVVLCGIGIGGQQILRVFDAVGRQVWSAATAADATGRCQVAWDGRDLSGDEVKAGTYFAELHTGSTRLVTRMQHVR
jgi:uncharacterized delta-60 repeat protein